MTAKQWRVLLLCIFINILDGFDILAIAYTAPAIGREWQLAPDELGVLFSLGLAGMMIGSIAVAPFADRLGRRPVIIACLVVAGLAMFGASLARDLTGLGVARIVTGLAIGGILPCINTIVAEFAPPRYRTMAVAVMQAGFAIGAALGGFLAVALLAEFGWRSVFVAGAVVTVVLVPVVVLGLPESEAFLAQRNRTASEGGASDRTSKDAAAPPTTLRALRTPLMLSAGTFFLSVFGFYFLTSWVPKLMADRGLNESEAVIAGALLTSGGIVAALGLGWLSLHRSLVGIAAIAAAASAVMTLVFGMLPAEVALVLAGASLLGLATNATQISIYALIPGLFPPSVRASATGLAIGIGRSGSVVGPGLAGYLLALGWQTSAIFALMALAYAIAVVLLIAQRRWVRF